VAPQPCRTSLAASLQVGVGALQRARALAGAVALLAARLLVSVRHLPELVHLVLLVILKLARVIGGVVTARAHAQVRGCV
jgi:hypothetical protein